MVATHRTDVWFRLPHPLESHFPLDAKALANSQSKGDVIGVFQVGESGHVSVSDLSDFESADRFQRRTAILRRSGEHFDAIGARFGRE